MFEFGIDGGPLQMISGNAACTLSSSYIHTLHLMSRRYYIICRRADLDIGVAGSLSGEEFVVPFCDGRNLLLLSSLIPSGIELRFMHANSRTGPFP